MKVENAWPNSGTGSSGHGARIIFQQIPKQVYFMQSRKSRALLFDKSSVNWKRSRKNNRPGHDRRDQIFVFGKEKFNQCKYFEKLEKRSRKN